MSEVRESPGVGRKVDVVLGATDGYDQYPNVDPLITLAESAVGRGGHAVGIDGRVVMKGRELLTIDPEPMRERVVRQDQTIMARFDRAIG